MMYRRLTTKTLIEDKDDSSDINSKKKTVRGKKYDFVKKVKKCNSTDIADLMVYRE